MTCEDVRDRLDDYVDGELAQSERDVLASHLTGCSACREQERGLRKLLAEAAALARETAPARELWPGIAERLRPALLAFPRRSTSFRPLTLAAAAAVLIALSSGVTWRVARRPPAPVASRFATAPTVALVALTPAADLLDAEREYASATSDLLAAIEARRDSLSPEAASAVALNMRVIDAALKSLRVALRSQPGNPELTQLLASTHKRKLEALRRVVRLSRI